MDVVQLQTFINNKTGSRLTRARRRSSNDCGAAAAATAGAGASPADPGVEAGNANSRSLCNRIFLVSSGALAPCTRSTTLPFFSRTKVGTASTSYVSQRSGSSSASTCFYPDRSDLICVNWFFKRVWIRQNRQIGGQTKNRDALKYRKRRTFWEGGEI